MFADLWIRYDLVKSEAKARTLRGNYPGRADVADAVNEAFRALENGSENAESFVLAAEIALGQNGTPGVDDTIYSY